MTLVTQYTGWKPIMGKESVPSGLSHDLGCLQSSNYHLHVSHEMVSNDQYVHFFSSLWILNCQEIYVDQA